MTNIPSVIGECGCGQKFVDDIKRITAERDMALMANEQLRQQYQSLQEAHERQQAETQHMIERNRELEDMRIRGVDTSVTGNQQ